LAVLAAAISTSAVAKDVKQNKQAPTVSATQMTNAEMDKVTAGNNGANGGGTGFGGGNGMDKGQGPAHNNFHARFQ
jgi:hypothetical protein